jgi:hypothetical protein
MQSPGTSLPPAEIPLPIPSYQLESKIQVPTSCIPATQDPFAPEISYVWKSPSATTMSQNPMLPGKLVSPWNNSFGALTSASLLPNWSTFLSAGNGGFPSQRTETAGWGKRTTISSPKFDDSSRLCLGDGWFLIRGDDTFFLEMAGTGSDIPTEAICKPRDSKIH